MYSLTSQTAKHLTGVIDILTRCDLDTKYIRGQGYDDASVMAGRLAGASTRIRSMCKKVLYVHCITHSLDLALQDLIRTPSSISIALNMTNDTANFMIGSPKRLSLLDVISGLNSYVKLKPLCPTGWTVHATSMSVLMINYSLVKTALTEMYQEGGRAAAKANGLIEQMDRFSSCCGLKLG